MNDHAGPEGEPVDGSTEDSAEAIGSVAEEAAKLFGALAGWAHQQGDGLGQGIGHGVSAATEAAQEALHSVEDHLATDTAECRWCPVCRGVQAMRGLSPEVRDHLATATASLVEAAAAVLATKVPQSSGESTDAAGDDRPDRTRPGGLEHIDLDDPGDWPHQ